MPVTPFLKGQAFDPEPVEAMGAAFSKTCDALGLIERSDPITALVSEKIIELEIDEAIGDISGESCASLRELFEPPTLRVPRK